jgi:hypothetical protein
MCSTLALVHLQTVFVAAALCIGVFTPGVPPPHTQHHAPCAHATLLLFPQIGLDVEGSRGFLNTLGARVGLFSSRIEVAPSLVSAVNASVARMRIVARTGSMPVYYWGTQCVYSLVRRGGRVCGRGGVVWWVFVPLRCLFVGTARASLRGPCRCWGVHRGLFFVCLQNQGQWYHNNNGTFNVS